MQHGIAFKRKTSNVKFLEEGFAFSMSMLTVFRFVIVASEINIFTHIFFLFLIHDNMSCI